VEARRLGRTGLTTTLLGFGCGAVGGLMVKGSAADQERAVARALELGINYFDTAPLYGNGESERNLGRVIAKLKPKIIVGTKVRVPPAEFGRIGPAMAAALDDSLKRLGLDSVDLYQLHNPIAAATAGTALSAATVVGEVADAFDRLRQQGKIRFAGLSAVGETAALRQVVESKRFDTAQVSFNLVSPSPGAAVPKGFPGQDYDRLLDRTLAADMGVIGIRALAGGALSGNTARHPHGTPEVAPIGSGRDYAADAERARAFEALVRDGAAVSLIELAERYAISHPGVSTMLIGYSTLEQLEVAAAAVAKGPLPPAVMQRIAEINRGFAGGG
jgi:aryl-alcohol dehydrogenase-like predicted oxidoreductase